MDAAGVGRDTTEVKGRRGELNYLKKSVALKATIVKATRSNVENNSLSLPYCIRHNSDRESYRARHADPIF